MGMQISLWHGDFLVFEYKVNKGIGVTESNSIFNTLSNLHTVLQNDSANLHSHPHCVGTPFSSNPYQHFDANLNGSL
jgi:hypothetical protein